MGLLWLKQRERRQSMPLPKSKMKLTLSEIDAPEYCVEFRLLYGMKYSEVKRLFGEDKDDDKK